MSGSAHGRIHSLAHWARNSRHPAAGTVRRTARGLRDFSLPAPSGLLRPAACSIRAVRTGLSWLYRVFVCEPYFKGLCSRHGRRLRTGDFLHFVMGGGQIIIGDDVRVEGKSSFIFASILPEKPRLEIGSGTYVNHNCSFIAARRISIGERVLIAPDVTISDSPGHSLDVSRRRLGLPPRADEIRPVSIGDDVWICSGVSILPGVSIGDGSIIALGSVVTRDIPANCLAAGVPARVVRMLSPQEADRTCAA